MRRPTTGGFSRERATTIAVSLSVLLALIAVAALSTIARPFGRAQALDELDQRAQHVEDLVGRLNRRPSIPTNAVCTRPTLVEASVLKADMAGAAARLGLTRIDVAAAFDIPSDGASTPQDLSTVTWRLEAAGPYASAVRLLRALDDYVPALLLDRVDLTSHQTFAALHLEGRLYCRAAPIS